MKQSTKKFLMRIPLFPKTDRSVEGIVMFGLLGLISCIMIISMSWDTNKLAGFLAGIGIFLFLLVWSAATGRWIDNNFGRESVLGTFARESREAQERRKKPISATEAHDDSSSQAEEGE